MKASLLLVDDDHNIAALVCTALAEEGYKVFYAKDADSAVAYLKKETVDLLLLDIELPGISGMKLLELLKQDGRTAAIPVIMLTVLGNEAAKVQGLKSGADDYLVKPFSKKELAARVEAVLRRLRHSDQPIRRIETDDICLDLDQREVTVKGKRVVLTPAEFDLLRMFVERRGYVFSYRMLADSLAQSGKEVTSESLYVHVNNLRRKLGASGKRIETVHGIGYKLAPR